MTTWSDLVFHVLAHVELAGAPANLHHAPYVAWSAGHLGPAPARALGQDALALARLLRDPATAASVQAVALLSPSARQEPCATDAAELLRCSALLEAREHARLPVLAVDGPALREQLSAVQPLAPLLSRCELHHCRALTRHGRLFGARVYVGVPSPALEVSAEQVAMQAAHEATVREVREGAAACAVALAERKLEAIAVVVLAARAARAGLAALHEAWARQWGVREEYTRLAALSVPERALATRLLSC